MKEVFQDRMNQAINQMPVGIKSLIQDLTLDCSYSISGHCLDSSVLQGLARAQERKRDLDYVLTPQMTAIVPCETLYSKKKFDSTSVCH